MKYLLGTCALLWLVDTPEQLSPDVREMLVDREAIVHVSAASAWELGLKVARGKLELSTPVSRWFPAVCRRYELHALSMDVDIAATATELPEVHRDPFDRILIATAIRQRLILATPDSTIQRYPGIRTLW